MKKIVFYIVASLTLLISSIVAIVSFNIGNYNICVYSTLIGVVSFIAIFLFYCITANWDVEGAGFYSDYV